MRSEGRNFTAGFLIFGGKGRGFKREPGFQLRKKEKFNEKGIAI